MKILDPQPVWLGPGIAIVRIITGLFMVYHGWEVFDPQKMSEYFGWDTFKSFDSPATMVYAGKAGELVAGLLLTIGLFTRIACLMMAAIMFYVSVFVGNGIVWYNDQHPFMFVLLAFVFFFTGPGSWAADNVLFSKRNINK